MILYRLERRFVRLHVLHVGKDVTCFQKCLRAGVGPHTAMLGVSEKDHHAPTSVVPRARLAVRNAIRSTPRATATILLLMVAVLVLTLWRCSGCPEASCRPTAAVTSLLTPTPVAVHRPVAALPAGESGAERVTAEAEVAAAGGKLQLAEVVVGLMTAQRFHGTRCRMQSATWLQRMRRVIFFTDSTAEAPEELQAPVLAHAFDAAPLERIFSGGNWRALPILREMAHMFFTDEAQAGFVARGEPPPRWAYMADDDAFAFHSQLLDTLRECAIVSIAIVSTAVVSVATAHRSTRCASAPRRPEPRVGGE